MAKATDAEARAAKAKVLKKDPGSKGFKFFRKLVNQIKETRGAPAKKAAADAKKKVSKAKKTRAMKLVNPSSAKRQSTRTRAKGTGIQT